MFSVSKWVDALDEHARTKTNVVVFHIVPTIVDLLSVFIVV